MGHSTNVYGIISNLVGPQKDTVWTKNMEIINSLPYEDCEYPCISSRMFSKDFQPGWEERVIHFAANYKNLEFEYLQEWVSKFEGLLSRMMWLYATAHIETDISGRYRIDWTVDNKLLLDWKSNDWVPTSKWTSTGLVKEVET